eukprot:1142768-Pelagomonas_calceolata.AAC.1
MAGVTCASLAHAAQASAAKTTEKFRDAQAQLLNAAPQQHRAENVCAREHIQNPPRHALTYLPPSLPSYSQESPFLIGHQTNLGRTRPLPLCDCEPCGVHDHTVGAGFHRAERALTDQVRALGLDKAFQIMAEPAAVPKVAAPHQEIVAHGLVGLCLLQTAHRCREGTQWAPSPFVAHGLCRASSKNKEQTGHECR